MRRAADLAANVESEPIEIQYDRDSLELDQQRFYD